MFRATDPNATKTIKHPADQDAEFDISISMSREDRTRYSQELVGLGKESSLEQQFSLWEKIAKKHTKGIRGVESSDGTPVSANDMDKAMRVLKEVRVDGYENLAVWLGQMIYAESVLTGEEKKRFLSLLTMDSMSNTERA